eukprot:g30798.t1
MCTTAIFKSMLCNGKNTASLDLPCMVPDNYPDKDQQWSPRHWTMPTWAEGITPLHGKVSEGIMTLVSPAKGAKCTKAMHGNVRDVVSIQVDS